MANVESLAPVIDLEVLLQPISEENPSGESLQYSGLYDEIREARRADLDVSQGQWQHKLKSSDYPLVISLSVPALEKQTKDLQIAVWLSEALTKTKGFVGLRDSLQLVSGLQQNFWETCFPEIEDNDQEGRANAIEWMDKEISWAIQEIPITGGAGLSFIAWEESKRFDIPENLDVLESADQERYSQLRAQAEQEHRTTGDMWRKAKAQTRRAFYEQLNLTLDECWAGYESLNLSIEEKFDPKQMPGMSALKRALDDIRTAVKKLLEEKRLQEPDAADESAAAGGEISAGANGGANLETSYSAGGTGVGVATVSGAIRSRQDALKRLADVADFFRQTEPHSPVSYLVQRAVKWGNMPLDNWLQEVIKDETVLGQLRETLGFGGGYAAGDGSTYSTDSTDSTGSTESTESSW